MQTKNKTTVILIIVFWLFCGWLGNAISEGFFWGEYHDSRFNSNAVIPESITYTTRQVIFSILGPMSLIGSALYLGNDKTRWQYPLRYCYWHHPINQNEY